MCLTVNSERKRAEEDIECIKILNADLISILYRYPYKLGHKEEIPEEDFIDHKTLALVDISNYELGWTNKSIVRKGFHSFKMETVRGVTYCLSLIVRCIIPKGSVYYEGHHHRAEGYASNAIIPVEILNTIEV